ncbi:MAG: hypothetical protein JRG91_18255 [Deltaproteobacteria bacterium]|nr:hypothetical protein [Deltaproteobacteria bacterium]
MTRISSWLVLSAMMAGCGGSVGQETDAATDDSPVDAAVDTSDPGTEVMPGHDCDSPHPDWLLCEDFEGYADHEGDFAGWYDASEWNRNIGVDDRGRLDMDADVVHGGDWALHMPAAESSGYRGGELSWRDCVGDEQTSPCDLEGHETLYFRSWIRFAEDHRQAHHFLFIGGSQPDQFWSLGASGCLPVGRYRMSTTVDFERDTHETFFYTYHPAMSCSSGCVDYMGVDWVTENCAHCADIGMPTCDDGLQCCWGDAYRPDPAFSLPVGEWFCLEMMLQANTPDEHDGVMAYWVNGAPVDRVEEFLWRIDPDLQLNRVGLQHYITTDDADGHSNRVWFDDVVVITSRIGCE